MSQFGKYVALGGQDSTSPFPESQTNWRELGYFRSWQAQGLVSIFYYFSLVVGIVMLITTIISTTQSGGVGGFFLGLVFGIIQLVLIVIGARISAEVVLSIYDIRDNVYRFSNGNAPTVIHGNPSNSTYQSYQQQPTQSYQQPTQSYQQPTYQPPQPTQTQQTSYQEPYQGTL